VIPLLSRCFFLLEQACDMSSSAANGPRTGHTRQRREHF
jgi:hypothetical protein